MISPRSSGRAGLLAVVVALAAAPAAAQDVSLAATVRNYNLLRLQDAAAAPEARRDVNLLTSRAMPTVTFTDALKVETHVVLDLLAPAQASTVGLPGSGAAGFLPLTHTFADSANARVTGRIDRLNAHFHTSTLDLTVGRQAITWGVNTLFPALDMFAPFAPTQIDRDYKAGVDAVRLTASPRPHVQLEAIGAQLGPRHSNGLAAGAMVHINAGAVDMGALGGVFHHDVMAGSFGSVSVAGTVLRGELSRTVPEDGADRLRRPSFWRAGAGLDRQLTATLNLSAEVAYNGFGEAHPDAYPAVLASARLARGEVSGPGQWAAGGTLGWHFHPLGTLSTLALLNLNDGSVAVMPAVTWSVNSRFDVLGGTQVFVGRAPSALRVPRSEYGGLGSTAFTGIKLYF